MKKLLSVLLTVVLVLSMGTSVYAAEEFVTDPVEDPAWISEEAEDVLADAEESSDAVDPEAAEEYDAEEYDAVEVSGEDEPAGVIEEVLEEDVVGAIAPVYKYRVYLPQDYSEDQKYPTVYLMPYDGYSADQYINDGIEALLDDIMGGPEAISMVVVMPEFTAKDNYSEKLDDLVEEIEENYSVIPQREYRAILGVHVGGYMALETALIEKSETFYCIGSHMGEFTGTENPYLAKKGSVAEGVAAMDKMAGKGYNYLSNHFFYIDAPNGSADSTAVGGTSDIGADLEKRSNSLWQWGGMYYLYSTPDPTLVEYAILDGEENSAFYKAGLRRSLNRFSQRFTASLIEGALTCTPQAVTSADDNIDAAVKVTVDGTISNFLTEISPLELTVIMSDPLSGEELYTETKTLDSLTVDEEVVTHFTLARSNMADGLNTTVTASISMLGMDREIASLSLVTVQDVGEADDEKLVDLMGNWYFKAYKTYRGNDSTVVDLDRIDYLTPDVYETWGVVQPCLGWWTGDFDGSLGGQDNYGGYAWYVRTFEMPADFPTEDLTMAVGYFDEANETYVNGELIGSSGMRYDIAPDNVGVYDGSNPWDVNCVYPIDSSVLNYGGTNTIAVRICNSSGGGGWYEGPVGIYSKAAYDKISEGDSRLIIDEYESASTGNTETFRIYLPEGYDDPGNAERYPSLYLFHGINSTSKTYEIDDIDQVLDKAIKAGLIRKMIVVIPDDPTKTSFWRGDYGDMVLKDLIPYVDQKYRTIDDERYRYTSGCSMGGAGSVGLGLFNPNLFSGVVSFYGALSYTSAVNDAANVSEEYLKKYAIYMACGNQDMYNFYDVQEQMSRVLTEKGIEHYHLVDNGTHTSSFYLPHFIESLEYILARTYTTATSAEILSGSLDKSAASGDGKSVTANVKLSVNSKITNYLNTIPASEFTKNENPALRIPVEVRVMQKDKIVGSNTIYIEADGELNSTNEIEVATPALDPAAEYTVIAYASALENTIVLGSITENDSRLFDDVRDPSHPYFTAVYWARDKGITKGYTGTNLFGIDDGCTRGQAMMFLWRLAGKPKPKAQSKSPFKDVPKTHTFYKAILWAQQKGITKGYSDGTFGINKTCTRGHIVTFIWRYKGKPAPKTTKNPFKDKITAAYYKAVLWAAENGVTKGYSDGTFRDTKECTRGQVVKFLYNAAH